MAIYLGSRYASGVGGFVDDAAGESRLTVFRGEPRNLTVRQTYTVRAGDRLDFIATRVYNRPDLWWLIADANDDLLLPDPLVPGTRLRIPDAPDDV